MSRIVSGLWSLGAFVALTGVAAAVPPYSVDFTTGVEGWRFSSSPGVDSLQAVSSGGPDGGAYVSVASNSANSSPVLFRANTTFPGIDLDFSGDWAGAGVKQISAFVRHGAPEAMSFFTRVTQTGTNFPGMLFASDPVQPNAWIEVFFNVTVNSPDLVPGEPADYGTIFSDIGNLQFGPLLPEAVRGTGPHTYDLDKVSVSLVPEPSAAVLALGVLAVGLRVRRRS